jgi:hypothetical protein
MSYQEFPPSLMVLSPRLTKAGNPSASIQGIDTTPLADGAVCYCLENRQTYQLDKTSGVTADGNLVIAPSNGPGRWITSTGSTPWTLDGEFVPKFQCMPFTSTVQSGGGPQVAAFGQPDSVLPLNTVLNYQVKINVGGAPGTATFDLSDDGGATFFLTNQTIPSDFVYLVPGRNYFLIFENGVFVVAETYDYSTVYANIGNGALTGNYRIVGDSGEIRLAFVVGTTTDFGGGVGTPTSQGILVPLPPGYVVDTNKIPVFPVSFSGARGGIIEGMVATQLAVVPFASIGIDKAAAEVYQTLLVPTFLLASLPVNSANSLLSVSVPIKQAA